MTSDINPAYPQTGNPTTASVRNNFAAAKAEIEALQGAIAPNVTQGAVVYGGASGAPTGDAATLKWDAANKFLGVGTAAPLATVHVNGNSTTIPNLAAPPAGTVFVALSAADNGSSRFEIYAFGSGSNAIRTNYARGTAAAPQYPTTTSTLGLMSFRGWDESTSTWVGASTIVATPDTNWDAATRNTALRFFTASGTAIAEKMRLSSAGSLLLGTSTDDGVNKLRVNGSVAAGAIAPMTDNTVALGRADARYSEVFAGNGTINTSDAREKTAVDPLTSAEIAASKALAAEIGTFRFLAAVAEKGDAARKHVGMTVQRAIEIMDAHGLDPFSYGFICRDEWPETSIEHAPETATEQREDDTEAEAVIREGWTETRPAGERYGFRADQLLMFIARGFDARLSALENA